MSGKELARIGDIIDGEVDPRAEKIDALERQVAKLRGELSDTRHELTRVREDSNRALTALRQQLSPLYRALQRVFGELEDAGVPDAPAAASTSDGRRAPDATDARVTAVWASWKTKLGGTVAKGIDALLLHGELDTQQLAIAAGVDKRTVTNTIVYKLHQAGLIDKNGGRFSLKEL